MKKSYLIKVMCFVYLFSGNMTVQAQEDSKQTASQTQNLITVWDGSTWSNDKPNLATKAVFAKDFITTENL